ncbi:MAG: hypothetical protein U0942_09810 [Parvibaculum sp.]|uniref:hypothetical protein n=1 Tax=Parvibaculum sp. TaxID=2024848 RepID=UPI002ABB76A7|nr:hypothetical protein [Parvibaculum sp.]MDZ4381624.1 hypothetical protein [Parvibaculum sp.]
MRKLPVIRSVSEVFSGVTRHYFQLVALTWSALLLIALSVGLNIYTYYQNGMNDVFELMRQEGTPSGQVLERFQEAAAAAERDPLYYVAYLMFMLASAVAAVRWHRFVLFGESRAAFLRFEDARYLWTLVKLFILTLLAVLIFIGATAGIVYAVSDLIEMPEQAILPPFAGFLIFVAIVALYLFIVGLILRLMMGLPDAAVGQSGRIFRAFGATRGNTWRLGGYAVLVGFLTFLVLLAEILIVGFFLRYILWQSPLVWALVVVVVAAASYFYFLMLQITMLSVAYREIVGLPVSGEPVVSPPDVAPISV